MERKFYCREWAFERLKVCLDKRPISATCGTLIMAESGYGKTTLSRQIVSPTCDGVQEMLSTRLICHHFCSSVDIETLSPRRFLLSLVKQINQHPRLEQWKNNLPAPINSTSEIASIDEYLEDKILSNLNQIEDCPETLFILVDGLDECMADSRDRSTDTIAHLLSRHHQRFPKWLALVCSCATKAKRITRLFTGFRKLSLDDIQKAHVIRDIQQYILHRLDKEDNLKRHLNRYTAEILDKLHVKSNGCILYIELVLDMVATGAVTLTSLRDIPGTLAGLYMWICQQLFSDMERFSQRIQPVISVLLASLRPINQTDLYNCLRTRNQQLTLEEYGDDLSKIDILLKKFNNDSTITLFHPSFRNWIQDVKFCSKAFICSPREGHEMIALYYTIIATSLHQNGVHDFAYHIQKCNDRQGELSLTEQAIWIIMSNAKISDSPIHSASLLESIMVDTSFTTENDPVNDNGEPTASQSHSSKVMSNSMMIINSEIETLRQSIERGEIDMAGSEAHDLLMLAVKENKYQMVETLLSNGILVDAQNVDGLTSLHSACMLGYRDIVSLLIAENAELDLHDQQHRTPLISSCERGYSAIVDILLNAGADVNIADQQGETAFLMAVKRHDLEITKLLIEYGSEVNNSIQPCNPVLCVACQTLRESPADDCLPCIKVLIESGAEVNCQNSDGSYPLHLAAGQGDEAVCRLLLDNGANVDCMKNDQQTPLFNSAQYGYISVLDLLILEGADTHHIDSHGRTALGLSCISGHLDIVQRFLDTGQDESHKDNYGQDCLHLCAQNGKYEVIDLLMRNSADVNTQDNRGCTPLYLAAESGYKSAVDVLLEHGAKTNINAHNGQSALRIACLSDHTTIAESLISHSADVNHIDIEQVSILYQTCLEGEENSIKLLLESGADINIKDQQSRTPLHVTCWQGHVTVVRLLLEYGADVNSEDCERRTPLQSAVWQGHVEIVELLCRDGANVNHMCDQGATPLCIAAQEGFLDVVTVLCEYHANPNHEDKFGRSAVKIAMKTGNSDLAKHIEQIMRKMKPESRVYAPHSADDYENISPHHRPDRIMWTNQNTDRRFLTNQESDDDDHEYERLQEDYRPEIISPYAVNVIPPLQPTNQNLSYASRTLLTHPPADLSKHLLRDECEHSSVSSDGCDTAPSSQSSSRASHGSNSSVESDNQPPAVNRLSKPKEAVSKLPIEFNKKISAQLAAGDHVHMANPKVNMAAKMTHIVGESSYLSHHPLIGPIKGKHPRKDSPRQGQVKMSALKNTTRVPAYKVHYAAAVNTTHSQFNYSVRNAELMSTASSLTSIQHSEHSKRSERPMSAYRNTRAPEPDIPAMPPRLKSPSTHTAEQKPTLVGVVLPRAQSVTGPQPGTSNQSGLSSSSPNYTSRRTSRKETSL